MKLSASLRWLLIPIVATASCAGVTFAAGVAGPMLHFAMSPTAFDTALPLDIRIGLVDGAAALAFVVAGTMIAPRSRPIVAGALYAVGAWIAWVVLEPWWFPENHPRAYQPSQIPFALTLFGGLIGVLITLVLARRSTAATRQSDAKVTAGEAAG